MRQLWLMVCAAFLMLAACTVPGAAPSAGATPGPSAAPPPTPAASAGTGTPVDSVVGGLSYALQYLAMCVLLILALVKSGSWARDIVGG